MLSSMSTFQIFMVLSQDPVTIMFPTISRQLTVFVCPCNVLTTYQGEKQSQNGTNLSVLKIPNFDSLVVTTAD